MKANTRQHYVPQFYLRGWENKDASFWAYPVAGGPPFRTAAKNVACEKGIYSHPASDNTDPLATEKTMASIEGAYARAWPHICDRALNPETRKNVARFVAFMSLRHPLTQTEISHMNTGMRSAVNGMAPQETVSFSFDAGESWVEVTAADVVSAAPQEGDKIKSSFLRLLPALTQNVAEVLFERKWGIVFSDRPAFVTSDNPVALTRGTATKRSFGFRTPGTQVFFPISPNRMLVIWDEWPHQFAHYKLTNADTFNRHIVQGAVRFVFYDQNDNHLATQIPLWRNPN
jgi:hypothetical protein